MKINNMNKLIYTPNDEVSEYVITFRDTSLGKLTRLEDGLFYWFPGNFNGTCLSGWVVDDIAIKMYELNSDWEDHLNQYH
jgi:hypothetical protein